MDNNSMKEYDSLRSEINQKIELHNTLLTFTITTTVAILTFALSQDLPALYLLSFCILIPMSIRITYYRLALSKLSAYIIVFLETELDGIKWETRNAMIVEEELKNKQGIKNFTIFQYYECLILAVISYVLYVIDYIKDKEINLAVIGAALWPLILVIAELLITFRTNSFDKHKQKWIEKWTDLKQKMENNSNSE